MQTNTESPHHISHSVLRTFGAMELAHFLEYIIISLSTSMIFGLEALFISYQNLHIFASIPRICEVFDEIAQNTFRFFYVQNRHTFSQ